MFWYFVIYYAISGIIWGIATQVIIENKGYSENWFIWGYLFEFIAVLVALSKPNMNTDKSEYIAATSEQIRKADAIKAGAWTCSRCGKFNYGYITTCTCGMAKADNDKPVQIQTVENHVEKEKISSMDNLDQIRKLKELLDIGAITQEEFDRKKAELL